MTITMDKAMSSEFYDILSAELRCLINEYDPDTGRRPSKKRMAKKSVIYDVTNKWIYTQPSVDKAGFVNLSNVKPCVIDISAKEAAVIKPVLQKALLDFTDFTVQHPGDLADDIAKNKIPAIVKLIGAL